jgi:mRNA interferase RelE/StbE
VESYRLFVKRSALKELEAVPLADRRRLVKRIRSLSGDPRPERAEKLTGVDLYRIRQGNYRVVYDVLDDERTVTIIKIGHRGTVYR